MFAFFASALIQMDFDVLETLYCISNVPTTFRQRLLGKVIISLIYIAWS